MTTNRLKDVDPTQTTYLRNAFEREMGKRFKALRGKIRKLIVDEDCFGLTNKDYKVTIMARFDFPRNADKIDAFMQWFNEQAEKDILSFGKMKQIGTGIERAWTDIYITDSYKRGVLRAKSEMTKEKFERPKMWDTGGIDAVMSMPIHLDRVGVVATRAFSELKGITSSMDSQISKVLAQGLIDGDNPLLLARKLTKTISGPFEDLGITDAAGRFIPAERRARTLARTEIIRAHHQGNVQEMENWGAVGVKVKAEFMTAGYHVCPECEGLQGKIFTLEQIRSMIPVHPNCRCVALPVKEEAKAKVREKAKTVKPIEYILREDEAKIAGKKVEHCFCYDKEGKTIFSKTGTKSAISFTEEEVNNIIKDGATYFTHNHPGDTSFSLDDIRMACKFKLEQMRARGPQHLHILNAPEGGWDMDYFQKTISPIYATTNDKVYKETLNKLAYKEITLDEANYTHFHKVWTAVAEELGLIYKRLKAGE